MKKYFLIIAIPLILFAVACGKYQKLLKSTDINLKYDKALEYYNNKDYYRALQLFESVQPYFRGRDKAELIAYYIANCYFYQQDYILASYYYSNFTNSYPRSIYAEECMFQSAYCKYLDSPSYYLDQTNTYDAIKGLQLFINMYPQSTRIAKCNELMDDLRLKLETKSFEIARLYFNIKEYKAAITSFKGLIRDYPETQFKEKAMFLTMKSYYLWANKSVDAKKAERYQQAIEHYKIFVEAYPNTSYLREADGIFKNANKAYEKLQSVAKQ